MVWNIPIILVAPLQEIFAVKCTQIFVVIIRVLNLRVVEQIIWMVTRVAVH